MTIELNPKHYRCLQCGLSWVRWHQSRSFRVYNGKRKMVMIAGAANHRAVTGHEITNPDRGPAV